MTTLQQDNERQRRLDIKQVKYLPGLRKPIYWEVKLKVNANVKVEPQVDL